MCGPIAIGIAGIAVSAAGSLAQGAMNKQAYTESAALASQNAEQERLRGLYEAIQYRKQGMALLSTTRAAAAAGGVGLTGSALEVLTQTAAEIELDVEAIKYGAQVNANNLEHQARIDRANANRAAAGGFWNAAAGAVTGASNIIMYQNRTVVPGAGTTPSYTL